MNYFFGIDVSLEEPSICVVNNDGMKSSKHLLTPVQKASLMNLLVSTPLS